MKMSENQLYSVEVEAVLKVAGLHVSSFQTYTGVEKEDALWYARGHYKNFLEGMFKGYATITLTSDVLHLRVGDSYVDVPRHFVDPYEDVIGCSAIHTNPCDFVQDYLSHAHFLMDALNAGGYRFRVVNSNGVVEFERTTLSKLYREFRYYYDLADEELLRTFSGGNWKYRAKGLVVFFDKTKDVFVVEYNGENVFETEYLELLVDFVLENFRDRMYEEYTPKVKHQETVSCS